MSVEMLERSYSFAIDDLDDEGLKPAGGGAASHPQIALTTDEGRRLRVA